MKTLFTALALCCLLPRLGALSIVQTANFDGLMASGTGTHKNHNQATWTYEPFNQPDGLLTSVIFGAVVNVQARDTVQNMTSPNPLTLQHSASLVGQFDFPFTLVQNGQMVSGSAPAVVLGFGESHTAEFSINHTFAATFTSPLHLSMFDQVGAHSVTAGINIYPGHWIGSLETVSDVSMSLTYVYADIVPFTVAQSTPASVPDSGSGLALAALACAFLVRFRRVVR